VLLHAKGYSLQSLAEIFAVHRDTVQHWLTNWERAGCAGLADMSRPGRPPTLSPQEEAGALRILQDQRGPRHAVLAQIRASFGKDVSQSWLTRFIKKHQLAGTTAAEGAIHLRGAMASKEATSWIP
jgi:transposase